MPWTSKAATLVGLCAISFVMFFVFAGPAGSSVAFAQRAGHCIRGLFDVLKVGILFGRERRGNTRNDAVRFGKPGKIARRFKTFFSSESLKTSRINMANVGFPAIELGHFLRIDIEAENLKALFTKTQDQRQPDIAKSDDANSCPVRFDLV